MSQSDCPKILLVEQGSQSLDTCSRVLTEVGFEVRALQGNSQVLSTIAYYQPHLILSEIRIGRPEWRPLLTLLEESRFFIPILFLASMEAINEVIEAMKIGAEDFLLKPVDPKALLFRVRKVLENRHLQNELRNLQSELHFRRTQDYIVGSSQTIQKVLGQVLKVAHTDAKVLISGETGTGKELIARAIHYNSKRSNTPFIKVNCSATPKQLMENQFFGHVRGGYTGADRTVKGVFEEADGGTIFLDEIGDLPNDLQGKLLKVLESGEFQKVGGSETVHVDVRNIAATNKDLETEIKEGRFREDLYHRLNSFPILAPPLRDRKEDIPLLVTHFFNLFREEFDKTLNGFSTSAIQKLMLYSWPGNVRELGNLVRHAMIISSGPFIHRDDIVLKNPLAEPHVKSFKEARQEFEYTYIQDVLQLTNGNVSEAARLAQKERKDFYDVMKKYGIKAKDFKN